jgi:hypothetical protein
MKFKGIDSSTGIIIIIIGITALFQPRPSLEASASYPYSLQHSSSFSPPTSWHPPSRLLLILVLVFPFAFFLLQLQQELFLQGSAPPVELHVPSILGG